MKRRDLMKMAPAMVAAGALPASALQATASDETPVMRLFREHEAWNAYINGPETRSMPDDEFNAVLASYQDVEDRMMAEPARNAQDVVAKVLAWTDSGGFELPSPDAKPKFWAEIHAMVAA
jgi:hypothetical protein